MIKTVQKILLNQQYFIRGFSTLVISQGIVARPARAGLEELLIHTPCETGNIRASGSADHLI